jgi:hypothetical protein
MAQSLAEIVKMCRENAYRIHRPREYPGVFSGNYLLDYFSIDYCRELDQRSEQDNFVKIKRDRCITLLKGTDIVHTSKFSEALQTYNEVATADHLRRRVKLDTPNESKANKESPDYIATLSTGQSINLELKTVSFVDPDQNFRDYQRQWGEAQEKNELARQGKLTGHAADSWIVTSPFKKAKEQEVPGDRKTVIERFIDKTNSQRPDQLKAGGRRGLLLIDTLILSFPHFYQDGLMKYTHPPCSEFPYPIEMSGSLWYTCFGELGQVVTDYRGPKPLNKAGILTGDSPSIEAIVYVMRLGGGRGGAPYLLGFYRDDLASFTIRQALHDLCDFINDEDNNNPWGLSDNPLDSLR